MGHYDDAIGDEPPDANQMFGIRALHRCPALTYGAPGGSGVGQLLKRLRQTPVLAERAADPSFGNQSEEVISITRDRLALVCHNYLEARKASDDWVAPLGITVTLWTILPLADFKDKFGLSPEEWQVILTIGALLATVWFLRALVRALQAPAAGQLVETIAAHANVLQDDRGLYLFKAIDASNCYRVLVYYDLVWECYLLPHADIQAWDLSDVSDRGPLATYAARTLGLEPSKLTVTPLRDAVLKTRKFSEFYKREKSYTFEPIHVLVQDPPEHLVIEEFPVGGRNFTWMTLPQLLAHPQTAAKNRDVIRHLEAHFDALFTRLPDSVPRQVVRF